MDILSGFVVYFLTWWTVLFAVLPWGAHPPENPEPGHAPSAPAHPRLLRKFLITTVVAAVIWVAIDLVMLSGLISFRDMAARM